MIAAISADHPDEARARSMRVSPSTILGEQGSLRFQIACLTRGLLLARPLWDVAYDLIVHNPKTNSMWRVQVKKARRTSRTCWLGPTHRKSGQRYPPKLIDLFAFERPDEPGKFWIVRGTRVKSGCGLTPNDWERWDLFEVAHEENTG